MCKTAKTQYTIQTIMCEVWHVQIWKEKCKYVWWINNCIIVLCVPTFNVKCSWDGLLGERNCFCVWPFWYSELCRADQCAGCEGSRVILPALLLTLDKYSSWRVGRVVPMIRSAVRTTLSSVLRSDLVAELNQTVIDVRRTDSMMPE